MPARRQFALPEEDVDFLDHRLGHEWEAVSDDTSRRVIIYGFPVPDGYNVNKVDLNLRIEAGYPDAQIDMVYFSPALALRSGRQINQLSLVQFDGKTWQQWSRHRTPQNPWVPGLDNIQRHLLLVENWLAVELKK